MHAWYFTFEFPPTHGGGLSTYMRCIRDAYLNRPEHSLVVFTLDWQQGGLCDRTWIAPNILLVSINSIRSKAHHELGHWVAVAHLFERFAHRIMDEILDGALDLPRPDYIEVADGFGIGSLIIQQKACHNSHFKDIPILLLAHTPTRFLDQLDDKTATGLPGYWIGQMERQAFKAADAVISPSQALLDVLRDQYDMGRALTAPQLVLPNPYSRPSAQKRSNTAADASGPCDHFFTASRMAHWKGVEHAILALQQLWQSGKEIPLHIYGEDTHFDVVGKSFQSYLTGKFGSEVARGLIQFKGLVPREQIHAQTQTAYAQLHPSVFDNFPYTVLEAMGEGRIVVAGTHGGIGEATTDRRELFLTDVTQPEGFADTLREVVAMSDEARAQMGAAAQARVAEVCDPAAYLTRKEAFVAELVAKPRTEPASFPFLEPPTCPTPALAAPKPDQPTLSIVVPYFNMGTFIDDTLASVCASTLNGWEVVLVNDGSTEDASLDKLEDLHRSHGLNADQLRILNVPNGGVARARNRGAEASRAPMLTLLDADDMIAPSYYEKATRIVQSYDNVAFAGCWIEDFNENGRMRDWATWNAEPPIQLILNLTNCQSLVYRREAFLADGQHDPDLRMFLDDWEGVIALIAAGHRGVMIPEPLFRYRNREGSIFRTRMALWNLNYEKIAAKHADIFREYGPQIAAFLNVNGSSKTYHVMGHPSPMLRT